MVKKPTITNKQTLPPPPSISSFSDEESPPSTSHGTKPSAASGAAVLRKHPEPSLEPTGGEKEEDEEPPEGEEAEEDEVSTENSDNAAPKPSHRVARRVARTTDDVTKTLAKTVTMDEKPNKNDKSSESEEEESTDEESSEDSGDAARQPKPLTQPLDSKIANDQKQEVSSTYSSSDSGSEDGEEDSKELNSRAELTHLQLSPPIPARESANPIADPSLNPPNSSKTVDGEEEEDESEEEFIADEKSSEDSHNTTPKENPPPQPRDSQNVGDDEQASHTSSSSGSGLRKDGDIESPVSDTLEPLSNKPIDSSAQPVEKGPNSGKQTAIFPAKISQKKRTAAIVRAGRGRKKELFMRIWSIEDELALLQGILEYKERHHVIPYTHVHTNSLLNSVKDSLSISVSEKQLNDKVRRMKKRYYNTTTRQIYAKKSKFSDPHNAAVFNLSKKIWDSHKEEPIFFADKITQDKKNITKKKTDSDHFETEYPSLYWLLRNEHANNALALQNLIPIANVKQLDEKCKKLEMKDIQLNMQKIELLSSAVNLIKDALPKSL